MVMSAERPPMKFSELVRMLEKHWSSHLESCRSQGKRLRSVMIDLPYSLVIEATKDPTFFGFYSPELEGFTGVGHSLEDCLYKAKWGMVEHVALLRDQSLPVPEPNPHPTVVVQNEKRLEPAA
jgi:predicted RNase H-like HicB family nuclease